MPTDGCSVYMPIIFLILSSGGAKYESFQYMVKFILTHIPVDCWVVELYVDRFFDGSGYAMVPILIMVKLSGLVHMP